jgi:molecular chaperone DnaK
LSKEEVEQMKREAEQYAAEDSKRKEEMDVRNTADSLVYTTEKTVRDHGDKIPADVKKEIDAKTAALKSALQGQDVDAIRSATQELTQVMQKVGASVYQQPGQPPPSGKEPGGEGEGDGGGEEGEEGTVEGEFREV